MVLSHRDAAMLHVLLEKYMGRERAEEFVQEVLQKKIGQRSTQESWKRVLAYIRASKPEGVQG